MRRFLLNRLFEVLFHEAGDPLGRPCAVSQPMRVPFGLDKETDFPVLGNWVEITNAFDVPAVPALAGIRDNDIVKRALFSPAS